MKLAEEAKKARRRSASTAEARRVSPSSWSGSCCGNLVTRRRFLISPPPRTSKGLGFYWLEEFPFAYPSISPSRSLAFWGSSMTARAPREPLPWAGERQRRWRRRPGAGGMGECRSADGVRRANWATGVQDCMDYLGLGSSGLFNVHGPDGAHSECYMDSHWAGSLGR